METSKGLEGREREEKVCGSERLEEIWYWYKIGIVLGHTSLIGSLILMLIPCTLALCIRSTLA